VLGGHAEELRLAGAVSRRMETSLQPRKFFRISLSHSSAFGRAFSPSFFSEVQTPWMQGFCQTPAGANSVFSVVYYSGPHRIPASTRDTVPPRNTRLPPFLRPLEVSFERAGFAGLTIRMLTLPQDSFSWKDNSNPQAAAPPLFSRLCISCPSRFR